MSTFTTKVYAPVDGVRTVFATQPGFATLAEAEKHATAESHGVDGATWEVSAHLPVAKAKSLVMASRNRTIGLQVQMCPQQATGPEPELFADMPLVGTLHLKAPGTCAALDALYACAAADATVPVVVTAGEVLVG